MNTILDLSPKRDKSFPFLIFGVSFLFFLLISWCAPHSSDDYLFADPELTSFRKILDYALHYGNGRLLGNLGAIYLVKHTALRVVVKAFTISALIVLIPAVLKVKSKWHYLLSMFLVIGCSSSVFAQVFSWTSGFQNYVPPVLLTLFIIYIYIYIYTLVEQKHGMRQPVLLSSCWE